MSTLKMTFSLASLIFLIALIAVPVMAQEDLAVQLTGVTVVPAANTGALAADAADRFTVVKRATTTAISGVVLDITATSVGEVPDLEERFLTGTTIALLAPAAVQLDGTSAVTTPAEAVQAKDVVISEIMWGLNQNADTFANRGNQQWIEFYNTTLTSSATGAIDTIPTSAALANWILYFVDTHDKIPVPVDATVGTVEGVKNVVALDLTDGSTLNTPDETDEQYILVDMVSNLEGGGWNVVTDDGAYGQSGKLKLSTADATAAVSLVSMYRNINYDNVTKDFEKATAAENRTEQLNAIPGGGGSGGWAKSTRAFDNNLVGSPGARHFKGALTVVTQSTIDRAKVIVNEIGNSGATTANHDWVEFKNVSGDAYNLKDHMLSHVTALDAEASLINFKGVDVFIPKDGVMLVLASDPEAGGHPIAGGINIKDKGVVWNTTTKSYDIEDDTDHLNKGATSLYYVHNANDENGFTLPDGDTLIILRSLHDKLKTDSNLLDVNGGLSITDRSATHATSLWPLKKTGAAHGGAVAGAKAFAPGFVYKNNNAGGGTGENHWLKDPYTGIGYKRKAAANDQNGGTPGYANDASQEFAGMATNADGTANTAYMKAPVTISEIMYAKGRNLPQWVELYNSSLTQAVNLKDFQLKPENMDDANVRTPMVTVKLADKLIQPNQTVLIISTTGGVANANHFPAARLIDLWRDGLVDRTDLEIVMGTNQREFKFLSETAFKITLMNKDGEMVDEAGNLGADGMAMWDLPTFGARDARSSIIRRYGDAVRPVLDGGTASTVNVPSDGTKPIWAGMGSLEAATGMAGMAGDAGWVLASATLFAYTRGDIYYGHESDEGTPGYRVGGPLPVSLSKFRPERLESGEIVIRWITESELNNAGFNILRSVNRSGEFVKVNTSLIAGQGTTSERTTYEWKDTSAKPNVVYYYQIQDVSLDGEVTILRQTRLKGDVSPAGKLTTTWGELKALQ